VKAFTLASANEHKAREFQALADRAELRVVIRSAQAVGGMPFVPEDTGTFVGNARQKARALQGLLPEGEWALADDSGLCVDELGGLPGVDSAIYAGRPSNAAANLDKLVHDMRAVPEGMRGAHFKCVLLAAGPDGAERGFIGRCDGRLLPAPRGRQGFGYDPLFAPAGHDRSFAELGDAVKSTLSHRARAWEQFVAWLRDTER
jgi:XTP/dITP diphosphohydrolase